MANVLHPHGVQAFDMPSRVYWAAGIGLALLVLLLVFSATSASDPAATATYLNDQPSLSFTPFVPML
jgi:hypothetical protein